MNLEGGAHRPLGVVAVGDRRAEQGHRRIADVLVDGSAEAVDDRVDQGEESLQQRVHVFRIELRREAGETNQIAEQHRDRPTVALWRLAAAPFRWRGAVVGKEPPAPAAIPIAAFVGVAASRARGRQGGAARCAELTSLAVLEFAPLAAQCFGLRFAAGRREPRASAAAVRSVGDVIARKRSRRRNSSGEIAYPKARRRTRVWICVSPPRLRAPLAPRPPP